MGRAEGVIDVNFAERRERGRKFRIVLRLCPVEAQVLEQKHAAGGQLGGLGPRFGPDAIAREIDLAPQRLGQTPPQIREVGLERLSVYRRLDHATLKRPAWREVPGSV